MSELTITVREAAKLTGIGISKLYILARREDFPSVHLGRKVLILRHDLEAWLRKVASGEIRVD